MTQEVAATPEALNTGDAAVIPELAAPEGEVKQEGEKKPELSDDAKKAKALERRVDRLTRDKYEMKAQLDQLRTQAPKAPETPATPRQVTQEEFARAVEEAAAEKARVQAVTARANEIADAGQKAFPDFGEKMRAVFQELPLFDAKGNQTPVMEAIADAEKPEAILHYLGSNPDEAAEIAELSPARQARRIALLEQQLAAKPDTTKTKSDAPKPLKPEKPSASKGAPDPSDTAAWIRYENARAKGRS